MNDKNNYTNVDLAWTQLHKRLQQDRLIPEKKDVYKKTSIPFFSEIKWISIAAVFALCFLGLYLFFNDAKSPEQQLFTVRNEKNAPTLVKILEDGSVVYLSGDASIEYPDRFISDKREIAFRGNAFFDIQSNPEKAFLIHTPLVEVEVLGTSFGIKEQPDVFQLFVRTGEVKITSKISQQSVFVREGEELICKSGEFIKKTASVDVLDAYLDKMHFKDESLINIIHVLNMHSDSVELILDKDIENRLLTVSFSNDSPQIMAELICLALNLHYEQNGNHIFITE